MLMIAENAALNRCGADELLLDSCPEPCREPLLRFHVLSLRTANVPLDSIQVRSKLGSTAHTRIQSIYRVQESAGKGFRYADELLKTAAARREEFQCRSDALGVIGSPYYRSWELVRRWTPFVTFGGNYSHLSCTYSRAEVAHYYHHNDHGSNNGAVNRLRNENVIASFIIVVLLSFALL